MQDIVVSESYLAVVRNAHNLADLIRKWRPELRSQTDDLQTIVVRAHVKLDGLNQLSKQAAALSAQEGREHTPNSEHVGEVAAALSTLEAAYQSLEKLKNSNLHPLEQ